MPSVKELEILVGNLASYHSHLTSLRDAMEALRRASDIILADVDKDRALISSLMAAAAPVATPCAMEAVTVAEVVPEPTSTAAGGELVVATQEPSEAPPASSDIAEGAAAAPKGTAEMAASVHESGALDAPSPVDVVAAPDETTTALAATGETSSDVDPYAQSAEAAEAATLVALEQIATTRALAAMVTAPATVADIGHEIGETAAGPASGSETDTADQAPIAAASGAGKVVDLAEHRKLVRRRPTLARRSVAMAASLMLTAGLIIGADGLMHTDIGQRILDLGTCDGDMLSAQRDCALLAWLML